MYKQIIKEAVNLGYKGLDYYRYGRDDFYYASSIIAMSDDYLKSKANYKKTNIEYYLGFRRTNAGIISDRKDNKLLEELLEKIRKHKIFTSISEKADSTILNDIQSIYYIIGHIYEKALDVIGEKNPAYSITNRQPLLGYTIEKEIIENLSEDDKNKLTIMILDLFTAHKELSNHFDEIIKKISIICNFDINNLGEFSITSFMEKITQLKVEIDSLQPKELFDQKNQIIKIKNTLNAIQYLKGNNQSDYKKETELLRADLKGKIKQAYIFFYNNQTKFRFDEILSYFADILQDPQSLSSTDDKSKSYCEEVYEEIISELNQKHINEIDDIDDFKAFTTRVSAPSFGLFKLLYTYEHGEPLCRLEVYNEMLSRIFGTEEKKIKLKTIEQIIKTNMHSVYDSVICSEDSMRDYIEGLDINEKTLITLIRKMYKIYCLDILAKIIPSEYIELFEEQIINLMNDGIIDSSEITAKDIYIQLIKK